MTSRYRIRVAHAADLDWLAHCACALAQETEDKALDPDTVRAGIAAGLADPAKARYFIAMLDAATAGAETIGVPVGTLMLTTEWSDWRNGDWWWIQSVYVLPGQRRQGVFATLYRDVEAQARASAGVVGLRLYAEDGNATAQRTYLALGMQDAHYRILEQPFGQAPVAGHGRSPAMPSD